MKKTSTHPHPVLPSYQSRDATCCVCHPSPSSHPGIMDMHQSPRAIGGTLKDLRLTALRVVRSTIQFRGVESPSDQPPRRQFAACCAQPKGNPIQIVKKRIAKISCLIPYKFQMVISSIPLCPKASGSDETSAVKSPFCRRIRLPPLAASIKSGSWAREAKASSSPTAVKTLPSITPIGGQMKPPTMSRIERASVSRNVRMAVRRHQG